MNVEPGNAIGLIALFGSGETSPAAQRIHHEVMSRLPRPVHAAIVETPAGFEPNSQAVAQRIANYLAHRLQNFDPQCELVPARMRGTENSPDDPTLSDAIFRANYVFMGPGSPTYAVRQLRDSFTWFSMLAQHRLGAAICFSSASTISISKHAMPVYEIYKVGEDLHWKGGLDFFSHFGLDLIITPHWNNNDGGDDLDTSRCYMGRERYERLLAMLPELPVILGIEENTGIVIDPPSRSCDVVGAGEAVIVRDGEEARFTAGTSFCIDSLGEWRLPRGKADIPDEVWARAMRVHESAAAGALAVPAHVKQIVAEREVARSERNWLAADQLRNQLLEMGWQVEDTPDGPQLVRLDEQ